MPSKARSVPASWPIGAGSVVDEHEFVEGVVLPDPLLVAREVAAHRHPIALARHQAVFLEVAPVHERPVCAVELEALRAGNDEDDAPDAERGARLQDAADERG